MFFLLLIASLPALHLSAQLTSVSVRTTQTSAFATTITFRIPEGAAQELIIREVGPTLGQFGVPNALTDPAFELRKNGAVIAGNDNWGDSNAAALREAFFMRGAFPFANGSKDAALLITLDPGSYSLRSFSGSGTGNGTVLHEIYAGPGGLQNLSITNVVQPGGQGAMILGLISDGGSYLVRDLGPALGASGAGDPSLSLLGSLGRPLTSNDNWGNSPDAANIAAAASQLGLPPLVAGSSDAAVLLQDVTRGAYTVVAQNNGRPGVSSLEIYDLAYARSTSPVPEPSTYGLFAGFAVTLLALRRKIRRGNGATSQELSGRPKSSHR